MVVGKLTGQPLHPVGGHQAHRAVPTNSTIMATMNMLRFAHPALTSRGFTVYIESGRLGTERARQALPSLGKRRTFARLTITETQR